jgi:hypothetical protein
MPLRDWLLAGILWCLVMIGVSMLYCLVNMLNIMRARRREELALMQSRIVELAALVAADLAVRKCTFTTAEPEDMSTRSLLGETML